MAGNGPRIALQTFYGLPGGMVGYKFRGLEPNLIQWNTISLVEYGYPMFYNIYKFYLRGKIIIYLIQTDKESSPLPMIGREDTPNLYVRRSDRGS
jgi:hypothetical protein